MVASALAWWTSASLTVSPLASRGNEQGLLGMAFHPDFAKNGFIYLYYTAPEGGPAGHVEIARFTMKGTTADAAIYTVVQHDVCVICDASKIEPRGCLGAPDLVLEVTSPRIACGVRALPWSN